MCLLSRYFLALTWASRRLCSLSSSRVISFQESCKLSSSSQLFFCGWNSLGIHLRQSPALRRITSTGFLPLIFPLWRRSRGGASTLLKQKRKRKMRQKRGFGVQFAWGELAERERKRESWGDVATCSTGAVLAAG